MVLGTVLHAPPGSPWILVAGAALLLGLHIGGGLVGIASGAAALVLPKGGRWHRLAGNVFFAAMLVMSVIGAVVSPLIHEPANVFGGLLAAYLVVTGWLVVRRKPGQVGRFEVGAMLVPVGVAMAMAVVAAMMLGGPKASFHGLPIQAPFVLGGLSLLAAGSDLSVVLRRGLYGAQRLARHLWRLCAALLIATASLFLGQPKVFPHALRGSLIMFLPEILVFAMMVYWLIRVRRNKAGSKKGRPPAPIAALIQRPAQDAA